MRMRMPRPARAMIESMRADTKQTKTVSIGEVILTLQIEYYWTGWPTTGLCAWSQTSAADRETKYSVVDIAALFRFICILSRFEAKTKATLSVSLMAVSRSGAPAWISEPFWTTAFDASNRSRACPCRARDIAATFASNG